MSASFSLLPVYQGPSSWWEHVPIAHWLVAEIQPKTIVELGTHYGVSFFSFCEAASRYSEETFVYAVDTWEGDQQAGFYGDSVYQIVLQHQQLHHKQRSRLIKSTFDEAAKHFPSKSIDIIHIDGLHTYDAVKHDFETWLPKLRENGTILFHDWNVRENDFGVWQLWNEVLADQRFQCLEVPNGHGLGLATLAETTPEWHCAFIQNIDALTSKGALLSQLADLKEQSIQTVRQLETIRRHAENLEFEAKARKDHLDGVLADLDKTNQQLNRVMSSRLCRLRLRLMNRQSI